MFDQVTGGPKPGLVADVGAYYHTDSLPESGVKGDVLVECTGVTSVVLDTINCGALDAITCLTGVSTPGSTVPVDIGGVNRSEVLRNDVVFGSVNANRRHYEAAATALQEADQSWLERLITRRVPLEDFQQGFARQQDDVKVVLDLAGR